MRRSPSCGSQSFLVPWSGTEPLTAAPSSPRLFSHREHFGDDAANSATSAYIPCFYTVGLTEAGLLLIRSVNTTTNTAVSQ